MTNTSHRLTKNQLKYQDDYAHELAESWLNGNKTHVRTTLRTLENTEQAIYLALKIAEILNESDASALNFTAFMHPNN